MKIDVTEGKSYTSPVSGLTFANESGSISTTVLLIQYPVLTKNVGDMGRRNILRLEVPSINPLMRQSAWKGPGETAIIETNPVCEISNSLIAWHCVCRLVSKV
jgi:hypothetical protein